ncbi:GNAT family N-acetyltransferase [Actinokineospora globicatena]|uniref:N-acetyltransferase n=1 Tax=Actinokineospora globicatena TaxID=103729 RepID=A0A9W6VB14_9PSEU|nr:GNAT family protein [Actinokineospora globicatena]MCP2301976.1 Protein N-acetyltransferase, RimJ/RimL family [Actinokineospora globicatena]GLW76362.1 N-acetyltransferase [Actinokineospora globicatena]GLW83198.1 N-acetyltransferase [Actinokineospora globicatena]GLW94832.1 N-acetyltransferase [Actinokineospora globicatena]
MPLPSFPIKTRRLVLRRYAADDLDALHRAQSREDVTRYLYWGPRSRVEVEQALTERTGLTELRAEGDRLVLAVELVETGDLLGEVHLFWVSKEHRTVEIGYIFHPDFEGHGYATEAAAQFMRVAFDDLHMHRVIARLDADNTASARLLERLGMRKEAHFVQNEFVRGRWADEAVYAMLASEWPSAQLAEPFVRGLPGDA